LPGCASSKRISSGRGRKGAGENSTGWEQPVENRPTSRGPWVLSGSPSGSIPREDVPRMEGTSGSAKRAPLRGGSREAALPEGPAQAGSPGWDRASGLAGELVERARFVHGQSGVSSRFCHELATEGVRVTRVGVTTSVRAIAAGALEAAQAGFEPLIQGSPAGRVPKGARLPRRRMTRATSGCERMGYERSRSCS
jgi:hypothetical protein